MKTMDGYDIRCYSLRGKVNIAGKSPEHAWRRSFAPDKAVELWSCLKGECVSANAKDEDGGAMKLWNHLDPEAGDVWELYDVTLENARLCRLDGNQSLALAWAIEKSVVDAMEDW